MNFTEALNQFNAQLKKPRYNDDRYKAIRDKWKEDIDHKIDELDSFLSQFDSEHFQIRTYRVFMNKLPGAGFSYDEHIRLCRSYEEWKKSINHGMARMIGTYTMNCSYDPNALDFAYIEKTQNLLNEGVKILSSLAEAHFVKYAETTREIEMMGMRLRHFDDAITKRRIGVMDAFGSMAQKWFVDKLSTPGFELSPYKIVKKTNDNFVFFEDGTRMGWYTIFERYNRDFLFGREYPEEYKKYKIYEIEGALS